MLEEKLLTVSHITPNSIAEELGIDRGDQLLNIDGFTVQDIIDYYFLTSDEYIELEILKPSSGDKWLLKIQKEFDEDLGIKFEEDIPGGVRRCNNNCVYCFIDQLPPGLRESLYIKDDDYRYSFLYGSYISMTNMSGEDLERIARLHISPLFVSVQAVNPDIRARMFRNSRAGKLMRQLEFLSDAGITIHTQVVVCPGINDGEELTRTLKELAELWPSVCSAAVVPVGLTGDIYDVSKVSPVDSECAQIIIDQVEGLQRRFKKDMGTNFAFIADEFFLKAEREIPPSDYYENYPQIENGVGLVRAFFEDLENYLPSTPNYIRQNKKIVLITGTAAADKLKRAADILSKRITGLIINVLPVKNQLFGSRATAAGLLAGRDVLRALKSIKQDENMDAETIVMLPSVMFKFGESLFLDGISVRDIEEAAGVEVKIVDSTAAGLLSAVLEQEVVV